MKDTPSAQLLRIDAGGDFQAAVKIAADVLVSGGVVAFPTETLYGLATDIRIESAVQRLFSLKERPVGHPILILISCIEALGDYASDIPKTARDLMKAFWPGDLTLVFKAGPRVSSTLTGGTGKIGIRLSSHPVAVALAAAVQAPITGTSANLSGRPPCRTAREILESFGPRVDLILDAGPSARRLGSTILDVSAEPVRLLREGVISRRQLKEHAFDV